MLDKKEIERLAFFARIKLTEEELQSVPKEVQSIVEYVQKISDVDTKKIEPLFHFPELKNVVREDVSSSLDEETKKKMIKMGKEDGGHLKVEAIL
jgi:aspartyl-tRNA(Asn)/glutamyl-tRNA(Gln) amidotransferase subunit C